MGYEEGMRAEHFLMSRLNSLGIPHNFVDDWYDFEILGQKVELKSCRISVGCRKEYSSIGGKYHIGRFDFTSEDNRKLQYKENVWVCFVVRHYDQFIILGLCKARKLEMKRYVNIHRTRDFDLLSLEDWISKHNT